MPSQASLQRYYPYLAAAGALVAVSLLTYQLTRSPHHPGLQRSNATRRRRGSQHARRHQRVNPEPDPGGVLSDEQLLQNLNQEGGDLGTAPPLGIHIPESAAEALIDTGHAAQQARGARVGDSSVDGREGRAERRRNSIARSENSFSAETRENNENQNLLTLLYTIAQDQAQRESYVHRGVTCNNCHTIPIRGIRYRCANCIDYDLCEVCENLEGVEVHTKTHLFYKIRIPAPFIGNPRHVQAPSYPGRPNLMAFSLSPDTIRALLDITKLEQAELEALYEQFKVLAASDYTDTRFGINGAISRDTFDTCFIPSARCHYHPPAPNLIYDRMFHFYDSKGDGVIDFEEFVVGVSYTNNKIKTTEKLKRIFQGYDLDGDGYVERKDFLRMFKAFYSLSKVLTRDTVGSLGDELYDPENIDRAPSGRQPISAVFTATIPGIGRSWAKPATLSEFDDEDTDSSVVLDGSYNAVDPKDSGNFRNSGATDPSEIARRNDFWAFDDTEETEGLLMLTDEESDVGSEVLYHMALRGINELLDLIFKEKEKAAIEARHEGGKKGHGKSPEPINNNSEEPSPTEASGTPVAEALSKEGEPDSPANREEREKDRHAAVREMAKQRGGEGRLNFEEFTKIMNGSNSKRLEFVGSWMDLASF